MDKKKILTIVGIILFIYLYVDEELDEQINEIDLIGTNGKTIFIVSGITGTPIPYEYLANHFNDLGYSVKVPILKNHGHKLSMVKDTTINEIKSQLKQQIQAIDGEVILIGTCSGALITLDLGDELDKSMILINPPIEKGLEIWNYLTFIPYIYRFDIGLLKDSSALNKVPRYNKYPINLLISINDYVETLNLDTDERILIIQSKGDIRAKGAELLHSRAQNSELLILENSGHLAFIDIEKELVFDKIKEFIE